MRGRLILALALLVAVGGCATDNARSDRPIPGMDDSRRVEQINASGR